MTESRLNQIVTRENTVRAVSWPDRPLDFIPGLWRC